MKRGFYLQLAVDGIRKNRKLYLPYLLTCTMMVGVYYILGFLAASELLSSMSGGSSMRMVLTLGCIVIAVFSAVFLFYTNSFLLRRRRKEFGLYSVLGMSRRNLMHILRWEIVISYVFALTTGLGCGIALSRLAELALLALAAEPVSYGFSVPLSVVLSTMAFFAVIFLLILINASFRVRFATPIELVRSENTGEKPPKANWVTGISGILLLAGAYWLAIAIREPLEALLYFLIAVLMVIIGTYLVMISGSVLLCRVLQKRKDYYYQAKHFVSVSSMAYRMKRNGAGLASICVILTMALVMVTSSACLYFGKEAALASRYPRDICAFGSWYGYGEGNGSKADELTAIAERTVPTEEREEASLKCYTEYCITGLYKNGSIAVELNSVSNMAFIRYSDIVEVHFIRLADFNRMHGSDERLGAGEALVCAVKTDVGEYFDVEGLTIHAVKRIDESALEFDGASQAAVTANLFVIVDDIDAYALPLAAYEDYDGTPMLLMRWYYEFDSSAGAERKVEIAEELEAALKRDMPSGIEHRNVYAHCREHERGDFYATFGGLFFIGILLSMVFLVSAALIIYYKQLCEGYEDRARFSIMMKVGMTKRDIRESISAQMLTVFLLPIALAAVHLGFAFPFIYRILMLFSVFHLPLLLLLTTAVTTAVCAIVYLLIYRVTSDAYYSIVAGARGA